MAIATTTLIVASLVAAAASTAMSMKAASDQAAAERDAANYQAQVALNNQTIANQNAKAAADAGQVQEDQSRMATAQRTGAIRAAAAANGLDPNMGSAVDIQSDSAKLGELDALTIRANTARTVYGIQTQAMNYGAQAGLDQATAANAMVAGNDKMFGDLLSGASSMTNTGLTYNYMNGIK